MISLRSPKLATLIPKVSHDKGKGSSWCGNEIDVLNERLTQLETNLEHVSKRYHIEMSMLKSDIVEAKTALESLSQQRITSAKPHQHAERNHRQAKELVQPICHRVLQLVGTSFISTCAAKCTAC